ncbi:lanthionine synthetase C family protein [Clostridium sardiniense]
MNEKNVKEIVYETAKKLSDYDYLKEIVNDEKNYIKIENMRINPFNEASLSHGIPSLCMLYGELSEQYDNDNWDMLAHEYIIKLGSYIENNSIVSLSMFSGIAGIALATVCMSKGGSRYKKFISNMNSLIKQNLKYLINDISNKEYVNMDDYDIISGISGIANYCILQIDEFEEELKLILKYIINLCENKIANGLNVPGWYIPSENQFLEIDKKNWANGCFNIGLSHGIPALLIVLSNAKKKNINVNGQDECIDKISEFLINFSIEDEDGCYWGSRVSFEEYSQNKVINKSTRDAWCYGTPGVAYSLLIAGSAKSNNIYTSYALKGMKTAIKRLKDIYSPTFCHGFSGIAYISNRFYEETGLGEFKKSAVRLSEKVLNFYDKNLPLNFTNIEGEKENPDYYDYIGLIDGVAGVLLTLVAIENGNKTPWDVAFGLGKV